MQFVKLPVCLTACREEFRQVPCVKRIGVQRELDIGGRYEIDRYHYCGYRLTDIITVATDLQTSLLWLQIDRHHYCGYRLTDIITVATD
jgi:hypothetical protein